MTNDSRFPPRPLIARGAREPSAGATVPPPCTVIHPLAMLLGWPALAICLAGSPPTPRGRRAVRRERER